MEKVWVPQQLEKTLSREVPDSSGTKCPAEKCKQSRCYYDNGKYRELGQEERGLVKAELHKLQGHKRESGDNIIQNPLINCRPQKHLLLQPPKRELFLRKRHQQFICLMFNHESKLCQKCKLPKNTDKTMEHVLPPDLESSTWVKRNC